MFLTLTTPSTIARPHLQLPTQPLHNRTTPTTAPTILLALTDLHLAARAPATVPTSAARCVARHLLVVASDLADDVVEGVIDVDARFRRGFDEFAAEGAG